MEGFYVLVSRKRIVWVDIAKAIAIILMIIGHEIKNVWVYTFIFSFHMPLFFILSGYTSSEVHKWKKLKRNIKKLFINSWLLAAIMILLLVFQQWILYKNINIWHDSLKGIFWGSNFYGKDGVQVNNVGVMWFMFAFFWAKVIYDSLQVLISNNKYNGFILGALAYISIVFSKHYWLPQTLDIAVVAAFFMWIGWYIKNADKKNRFNIVLNFLVVSFWIICVLSKIHIELATRSYPLQFVSVIEAVAGSMVIIELSKKCEKIKILSKLSILGQHTLAILCIHHLDLYWIWWSKFINNNITAAIVRLFIDLSLLILVLYVRKAYRKIGKHTIVKGN